MKRSSKLLVAALFAAIAFLFGVSLRAQVPPPAGGFKNAFLNMNKSGKVVLTYTRWSDQVGKGSYTLVFFWASYSDEAREEVPYVKAIQQKYAGKVKVLGVTYCDEIQDSMDAMVEQGIKYPQIVDVDDDIAGLFGFDSLPFIALLGPDGKEIARDLHGEEIDEAVKGALSD